MSQQKGTSEVVKGLYEPLCPDFFYLFRKSTSCLDFEHREQNKISRHILMFHEPLSMASNHLLDNFLMNNTPIDSVIVTKGYNMGIHKHVC